MPRGPVLVCLAGQLGDERVPMRPLFALSFLRRIGARGNVAVLTTIRSQTGEGAEAQRAREKWDLTGVRRFLLLVTLGALAAPPTVHSQTIGNIRIGPADKIWATKPGVSGGLIFDLALDDAGRHCIVNVDSDQTGSGDAAADFDKRWKALVGPDIVTPTTERKTFASGWTSLFGERAGRTSNGGYRTLALFTISNGSRTQSVAASANDERCLQPLKALVRTVAVVDTASEKAKTRNFSSSTPSAAVAVEDIVGRWKGLRTTPGLTPGTEFVAQQEILVFASDGSYVSESPYYFKARYAIDGDKVILDGGRELTYTDGTLIGYQSVYIKSGPRSR